ncbi:MAG TPA: hypothetical protein VK808_04600 [Bacteroidia bacterium]|jgi:hypothetical protein|nr:hypothetical protein [Bacteroidia bacterium]
MKTLITIQSGITNSLIYGIAGMFLVLLLIFISNLISRLAPKLKQHGKQDRSLKEIIANECTELRHKEINLEIFAHEMYCTANTIRLYFKKNGKGGESEYIILLETDKGNLAEIGLDYFHANEEFFFICQEDMVAKEGKPLTINIFAYSLFDKNLEKEIINEKEPARLEAPTAA